MKSVFFLFLFLINTSLHALDAGQSGLLEHYSQVYDFSEYKGQTYLSFMQETVKPAMDELATEGYEIVGASAIETAYNSVDKKVQGVVEKNGGLTNVKKIATALKGKTVTLNTLPEEIAKIDRNVNRYNLATFLGLANGGGVVIQYYENNYAYNVHYDTTEQKSGRSFGEGPTRLANDASDKQYLDDIEEYSRGEDSENVSEFNKALLESLLNSDSKNYKNVTDEGQTVLTDFLAVYTAEQARNLMDGRIHTHWDAALLEVTLLASFHSGQEVFKLYYENPKTKKISFTDTVLRQTPCEVPQGEKTAGMRDYWQFSRRIDDPKNCKRSGINITKREFRKLGTDITSYMAENYPELVEAVRESMDLTGKTENLYQELSEFLIDDKTPKKLGRKSTEITKAWGAFLAQVKESAQDITAQIEAQ